MHEFSSMLLRLLFLLILFCTLVSLSSSTTSSTTSSTLGSSCRRATLHVHDVSSESSPLDSTEEGIVHHYDLIHLQTFFDEAIHLHDGEEEEEDESTPIPLTQHHTLTSTRRNATLRAEQLFEVCCDGVCASETAQSSNDYNNDDNHPPHVSLLPYHPSPLAHSHSILSSSAPLHHSWLDLTSSRHKPKPHELAFLFVMRVGKEEWRRRENEQDDELRDIKCTVSMKTTSDIDNEPSSTKPLRITNMQGRPMQIDESIEIECPPHREEMLDGYDSHDDHSDLHHEDIDVFVDIAAARLHQQKQIEEAATALENERLKQEQLNQTQAESEISPAERSRMHSFYIEQITRAHHYALDADLPPDFLSATPSDGFDPFVDSHYIQDDSDPIPHFLFEPHPHHFLNQRYHIRHQHGKGYFHGSDDGDEDDDIIEVQTSDLDAHGRRKTKLIQLPWRHPDAHPYNQRMSDEERSVLKEKVEARKMKKVAHLFVLHHDHLTEEEDDESVERSTDDTSNSTIHTSPILHWPSSLTITNTPDDHSEVLSFLELSSSLLTSTEAKEQLRAAGGLKVEMQERVRTKDKTNTRTSSSKDGGGKSGPAKGKGKRKDVDKVQNSYSWCDLEEPMKSPTCPLSGFPMIMPNLLIKFSVCVLIPPVLENFAEEYMKGQKPTLEVWQKVFLEEETSIKKTEGDGMRMREKENEDGETVLLEEESAIKAEPSSPKGEQAIDPSKSQPATKKQFDTAAAYEIMSKHIEEHYFNDYLTSKKEDLKRKVPNERYHAMGERVQRRAKELGDDLSSSTSDDAGDDTSSRTPIGQVFTEELTKLFEEHGLRSSSRSRSQTEADDTVDDMLGVEEDAEEDTDTEDDAEDATTEATASLTELSTSASQTPRASGGKGGAAHLAAGMKKGKLLSPKIKKGLYKAFVKPMIANLVKQVTYSVAGQVVPAVYDGITDILRDELPDSIKHTVLHVAGNGVGMAVGTTVPESVERILPITPIKMLTQTLTHVLTRSVSHAVSSTLVHSIGSSPIRDYYCYYCQYYQYTCKQCHEHNTSSMKYGQYYSYFFSSYFSDYYAALYAADIYDIMKRDPGGKKKK